MESTSDQTVEAGLEQGFVRIEGQNAGFMDPVRVLSASYELHEIKSERYYSRAFFTSPSPLEVVTAEDRSGTRKRKRKRKVYTPNEKEAIAESRHQVRVISVSFILPSSRNDCEPQFCWYFFEPDSLIIL